MMFEIFKWKELPEGEQITLSTLLTIIVLLAIFCGAIAFLQWIELFW